jgi:hypothetical protein
MSRTETSLLAVINDASERHELLRWWKSLSLDEQKQILKDTMRAAQPEPPEGK